MQASLLFSLGLYVSLSYGTIRRERGWTLGAGVGEVVGLQVFPPDAARDRRVGAGGVRHARTDAHRRRQVAALPAADDGRPGSVHSRHAAHRPYEGSGRPPAVARHSRRGRPFGHGCAPHRHSAGQLRLRRREVSLYRTRASGHGYVPPALAAHECRAAGRRRGALHIAVGLRLPTLLPPHSRDQAAAAGRARAGAHGIGDGDRRGRYNGFALFRRAAHHAQQFRPSQPVLCGQAHRGQVRSARAHAVERRRLGHSLYAASSSFARSLRPRASARVSITEVCRARSARYGRRSGLRARCV